MAVAAIFIIIFNYSCSPPQLSRMYRLLTTCYFEEGADVSACVTAARLAAQLHPCAESRLLLVKCLAVSDKVDLLLQQLEVNIG